MAQVNYPRRKPTRLRGLDYQSPNNVFFLTLCCKNGLCLFVHDDFNRKVVQCIGMERERVGHAVYVYCLMPDHIHLLSSPIESGISVSQFMSGLSGKITRLSWEHGFSGKVMQRSFHDHLVRKDEDMRQVAEYIINNPVRKGLVDKWEEYPYCGFLDQIP